MNLHGLEGMVAPGAREACGESVAEAERTPGVGGGGGVRRWRVCGEMVVGGCKEEVWVCGEMVKGV